IMEYLVKISKKACILELKLRHLKITVLTSYTPYPSRKIRRIYACTSQETMKNQSPIRRIQETSIRLKTTKVIKEEFEKLESLQISDDLFTCNTSLEIFNKEFNWMSRIDGDLFTYEVEILGLASVPCDLNDEDVLGSVLELFSLSIDLNIKSPKCYSS
ncbi:hypothetical protein Tco_0558892, partial [Tanacetum coccineum]